MVSMPKKFFVVPILSLAVALFLVSGALAAKLLCVNNQELHGQESVSSCLATGGEFAIVDQYGAVHIMTKREVELTKAFNPQFFETPAYSFRYGTQAPELKAYGSVPLPRK
jgi:hypothetical protein